MNIKKVGFEHIADGLKVYKRLRDVQDAATTRDAERPMDLQ